MYRSGPFENRLREKITPTSPSGPARTPTGTLGALTQLVGNHGGATAPPRKPKKPRNIPKGKAWGWHRKFGQPGANLGPLANNTQGPGNQSRRDNFQNALQMNRQRNASVPRRSAPRRPDTFYQ